jgi:hypothetical protein
MSMGDIVAFDVHAVAVMNMFGDGSMHACRLKSGEDRR